MTPQPSVYGLGLCILVSIVLSAAPSMEWVNNKFWPLQSFGFHDLSYFGTKDPEQT